MNFLSFVLIQRVKEFGIVNKGEVNIILELSCFFNDPKDVANLISGYLEVHGSRAVESLLGEF